jgi:hypothetical protein
MINDEDGFILSVSLACNSLVVEDNTIICVQGKRVGEWVVEMKERSFDLSEVVENKTESGNVTELCVKRMCVCVGRRSAPHQLPRLIHFLTIMTLLHTTFLRLSSFRSSSSPPTSISSPCASSSLPPYFLFFSHHFLGDKVEL